ncbi:unnamed protein product [Durusdinium trenchii]|uniref:Uncharacterized protein n=2 Tax=Durusdinium trenchii TaxID=1381693 RepID=A0ABP0IPM3_9DINO
MVAEGNLHERIVRADEKRWISEMQNGTSGLSAKATEFVPGGRALLSPKATDFVPRPAAPGADHQWGWNASRWNGEMANGAWGGAPQGWGYNGYDPSFAWQGQGVGAQSCLFNDDAYSTDSSSSSEPEVEEDVERIDPSTDPGAQAASVETAPVATGPSQGIDAAEESDEEDSDDSDEFNSFSEDEPELDLKLESATLTGIQRNATEVLPNPQADVRDPDSPQCKYDLDLMLAVRRAVAASDSSCSQLRWSTQAHLETTPDWLRRRAEADAEPREEKNGKDWRARGGAPGEVTKSRRRGQEGKTPKSEKPDSGSDLIRLAPKLEVSETSWAAQIAKRKAELEKESSDDSFVKSIRSILNKLTVEKFDTLSDQIVELIAQSQRPNRGIPLLMQLVFEKATTQHHFINMYVSLCVKLHKWLTDNVDVAESQSNFKRVLLNQCQTSFEQYLEPPEGFEGLVGDDLYEAQVKYKTKMLGNIRLVGQLIRHGMLAPKIAIAVATELAGEDPAVRGERLETLATFLETVGVALDDPSWKHHSELELVFTEVERASADKSVPRRVRCLLQDVLDLRKEGWKSQRRKDLTKETPQTLAQVHEQAKADQVPLKKEITRSVSYR